MSDKSASTEVALSGPLEAVFANPETVKENIAIFRKALPKLLDPDVDMAKIQGKDFIRKSGWNVINAYFNVTTRPTNSWRVELPDNEYSVVVVVEAVKGGRSVSRSAECTSLEMKEKHGNKDYASLESNCYGMAETRAVGRASAAWYMVGDVSAEEVEGSPGPLKTESEFCNCPFNEIKLGITADKDGLYTCVTCNKKISKIRKEEYLKNKKR